MTKYPQESIKPYNEEEKKSVQVERMFDNIAPAYDQLNHTLSYTLGGLVVLGILVCYIMWAKKLYRK